MTATEIIAILGGYRDVAAALRCDPSRPFRWCQGGIPPRRWPALLRIARERGVPLDLAQLEAAASCRGIA